MTLVIKVGVHNFWLFIPYIFIRYKVFIREDGRRLFAEFNLPDFTGSHYVLLHNSQVIGTVRVIYHQNIAQIGRLAIAKEYRKQGYGKFFMHEIIRLIQSTNKAHTITLLAFEPNLVNFYTKFGFQKDGIVYFAQSPFIQMSKFIH